VDQDQSDNVTTHYWFNNNTVSQQGTNAGGADLINGSDNLLLTHAIDPTVGCTPWMVNDQTNNNQPGTSLPLDELQAAAYQANPKALVPMNDPMVLVGTATNPQKTDLYREGVDQPLIGGGFGGGRGGFGYGRGHDGKGHGEQRTGNGWWKPVQIGAPTVPTASSVTTSTSTSTTATPATTVAAGVNIGNAGDPATYCKELFFSPNGISRIFAGGNPGVYAKGPTLDAAVGNNLFSFLAARATASFGNLGCANFGLVDPITLTLDGNGAATDATYNANATATATTTSSTTTSSSTSTTTSTSTAVNGAQVLTTAPSTTATVAPSTTVAPSSSVPPAIVTSSVVPTA
jgi:hypothetical protein